MIFSAARLVFRCVAAYTEATPPTQIRRSTVHLPLMTLPTRASEIFCASSSRMQPPHGTHHSSRFGLARRGVGVEIRVLRIGKHLATLAASDMQPAEGL